MEPETWLQNRSLVMTTSTGDGREVAPLGKGNTVPLFKGKRIKRELVVDLSWETAPGAEEDYDLDLSAFLVTRDGTVPHGNRFYCVYYNSERSADNSTWHHAATRHPEDQSDEEIIYVHLNEVNDVVDKIVFVVSIYEGEVLGHTFDRMTKAQLTIRGEVIGGKDELVEIATDTIAGRYENQTAVIVGEIHRTPKQYGGWEYRRIDRGFANLVDVGAVYGVVFG
jgi:tellurium resistance protein TerD